jgi:putative transposase
MSIQSQAKILKTLKVKIKLDSMNQLRLDTLSNEHRQLYNHLMEFVKSTKTSDFKDIIEKGKTFRNDHKLTISAKSAQNTTRLFIQNIKSFYALKKKDKTAHFPYKFKSHKYFTSFTHDVNGGNLDKFDLSEGKLILRLLNKQLLTISLPKIVDSTVTKENLKTVTFFKDKYQKDYYLSFSYEVPACKSTSNDNFLSIDLGLKSIATCFSNATDSFSIENSRFKNLDRQVRKAQSKKDLCKQGSRRQKKLAKAQRKLSSKKSNKTKDFQHKASKEIVKVCKENNISKLIIGDIKTKKLKDSKTANKGLNRSTQNEGTLSRFKGFLKYKAKESGLEVSLVNEAYTSQENCLSGVRNLSSDLGHRTVQVSDGLTIDRDLNSAINISKRIKPVWFRHFDEEVLKNINASYQEMYFDLKLGRLIRK